MSRSFKGDVEQIQKIAADLLECNEMNNGNFEALQRRVSELESRPTLGSVLTDEQVQNVAKAIVAQGIWASPNCLARAALSTIVLPAREVSDEELAKAYAPKSDLGEFRESTLAGLRRVLALGNGVYPAPESEELEKYRVTFGRVFEDAQANMLSNHDNFEEWVGRAKRAESRVAELEAANAHGKTLVNELTKERDELNEECRDRSIQMVQMQTRITELEKERDEATFECLQWREEALKSRARIADLTKPIDPATDEQILSVYEADPRESVYVSGLRAVYAFGQRQMASQLASLPTLAPVDLTDAECDRLKTIQARAFGIAVDKETGLSASHRAGVRALLAAAGRYVQPVSARPATDEKLANTWAAGYDAAPGHRTEAALRAVYDLGRSHGQPPATGNLTPWTPSESDVEACARAINGGYPPCSWHRESARAALEVVRKVMP